MPALYGPASNQRTAESQPEPPDQAFLDDWLLRSCEIVDKYQPQVVYFDWWICQPVFQPYLAAVRRVLLQPRPRSGASRVAINFKEWEGRFVPRRHGRVRHRARPVGRHPPRLLANLHQCLAKLLGLHHQSRLQSRCSEIVDDLIDIVSKNGAMLLNIGPKADGTIPAEEVAHASGRSARWLAVNGEAIYGTRPWTTFGEGPTQIVAGSFSDGKTLDFTGDDFRFTTKGDTLYALGLRWPTTGVAKIESLGKSVGELQSVKLLGVDEPVVWRQTADSLEVDLPAKPPNELGYSLEINLHQVKK